MNMCSASPSALQVQMFIFVLVKKLIESIFDIFFS